MDLSASYVFSRKKEIGISTRIIIFTLKKQVPNKKFTKGSMPMEIVWQRTTAPKAKPDPDKLGFGRVFTDHMFVMDYNPDQGWHDPRIIPYGPLELDPATVTLHYAQAVFEGMKAYRTVDGRILLFRPRLNLDRLNQSCDRLCIPPVDTEF